MFDLRIHTFQKLFFLTAEFWLLVHRIFNFNAVAYILGYGIFKTVTNYDVNLEDSTSLLSSESATACDMG